MCSTQQFRVSIVPAPQLGIPCMCALASQMHQISACYSHSTDAWPCLKQHKLLHLNHFDASATMFSTSWSSCSVPRALPNMAWKLRLLPKDPAIEDAVLTVSPKAQLASYSHGGGYICHQDNRFRWEMLVKDGLRQMMANDIVWNCHWVCILNLYISLHKTRKTCALRQHKSQCNCISSSNIWLRQNFKFLQI